MQCTRTSLPWCRLKNNTPLHAHTHNGNKEWRNGCITTQGLCWWKQMHINTFFLPASLTSNWCHCCHLCHPPLRLLSVSVMSHWATSGDVSKLPDASLEEQIQLYIYNDYLQQIIVVTSTSTQLRYYSQHSKPSRDKEALNLIWNQFIG